MLNEQDALYGYVLSLFAQGMSREQVIAHLLDNGHDEVFAKELVAGALKLRDAKKRHQGLVFILFGAFVCLLSFALTITSSFTQSSFPYVLFGLTSLGIIIVFAGFIKIF
ncbi:MAG: hypothetical protein K0Q79_522 [Flavipsychrobacter sp.]|jgi:hypothetical protein|nr:hypothetical protein [Flavipsychrobacter sp.]